MNYVHPLFKFLQKGYDGSARFKTLKNHKTNDLFTVPGIDIANMNAKVFYNNFLTENVPLMVQNGCQNWPAVAQWKDKVYLAKQAEQLLFQPSVIDTMPRRKDDLQSDFVLSIENVY